MPQALATGIAGWDAPQKQLLKGFIDTLIVRGRELTFQDVMAQQVRNAIKNGARDQSVREKSSLMEQEQIPMLEFTQKLKREAHAKEVEKAKANAKHSNGNRRRANAVDTAQEEERAEAESGDDDDAEVAKVQKAKKKTSKGKKKTETKDSQEKGKKKSIRCDYCNKFGHTEDKCYIKKFNTNKDKTAAALTTTTPTGNARDTEYEDFFVNAVSLADNPDAKDLQSGNANGF
jgi:hypothetical protein